MWKFAKGHSQDVFPRGSVLVVQRAEPAQVVVQVVGGDAVKAMDPLFETRVVGVDVLNMDCTLDAYACAQVDGVVGDAAVLCKVAVGRIAIDLTNLSPVSFANNVSLALTPISLYKPSEAIENFFALFLVLFFSN